MMRTLRTCLSVLLLATTATPLATMAQDYDTLIKQAMQQRDAGNLPVAEKSLRQAQALAADKSEASMLLGMVLAFQQKFGESLSVLNAALKDHPASLDLQLARARVLSYQGVYQDAASTVQDVLAKQPGNTEALALAGRIAHYQKRPVAAQLYYSQVLEQDLDNLDALIGMYDSYLQEGKIEKAKPYLALAAKVSPTHIDVLARQQPEQYNNQPRHQLSAGYGRSTIERVGFSDWHDRFVEYRHLSATGDQQYLRVGRDSRFGMNDTVIEAGLAANQHGKVPLEVAVGYTPHADFSTRYFGRLSASTPLTDGSSSIGTVILNGGFQFSQYSNGNTKRVQVGLEWYVPNTNLWLTPSIGAVRDQSGINTTSWSLGMHWQAGGTSRFGASYTDAPETEDLITRGASTTSFYWRQDLGPAWVMYLTWSRFDIDTLYVRKAVELALQYKF